MAQSVSFVARPVPSRASDRISARRPSTCAGPTQAAAATASPAPSPWAAKTGSMKLISIQWFKFSSENSPARRQSSHREARFFRRKRPVPPAGRRRVPARGSARQMQRQNHKARHRDRHPDRPLPAKRLGQHRRSRKGQRRGKPGNQRHLRDRRPRRQPEPPDQQGKAHLIQAHRLCHAQPGPGQHVNPLPRRPGQNRQGQGTNQRAPGHQARAMPPVHRAADKRGIVGRAVDRGRGPWLMTAGVLVGALAWRSGRGVAAVGLHAGLGGAGGDAGDLPLRGVLRPADPPLRACGAGARSRG